VWQESRFANSVSSESYVTMPQKQRDRAEEIGQRPLVLLRLTPGVDPHTHQYTTTGTIESKFGFPLATGQAEEALARVIAIPSLNLVGLHSHLGSSIFEIKPYQEAIEVVLHFAVALKEA
jgi:diaminopimelate decarboxylase